MLQRSLRASITLARASTACSPWLEITVVGVGLQTVICLNDRCLCWSGSLFVLILSMKQIPKRSCAVATVSGRQKYVKERGVGRRVEDGSPASTLLAEEVLTQLMTTKYVSKSHACSHLCLPGTERFVLTFSVLLTHLLTTDNDSLLSFPVTKGCKATRNRVDIYSINVNQFSQWNWFPDYYYHSVLSFHSFLLFRSNNLQPGHGNATRQVKMDSQEVPCWWKSLEGIPPRQLKRLRSLSPSRMRSPSLALTKTLNGKPEERGAGVVLAGLLFRTTW